MKILTIIPARCGSKGIKDKNIIDVWGKPLIAYSIELGLELKKNSLVDTVMVSTDCEKIANVAKKYDADVPFLRPGDIASDTAKSIEYYLHVLGFYKQRNIEFDAVLLLQPTSPLRTFELLKNAIEIFKSEDEDSLISVYKEEYINDLVMYKNTSEVDLKPLDESHNKGVRRQDHESTFVRNGAVYLTKVAHILEKQLIISDNPLFIEMKKSDSLNIDTMEDLELVRKTLCK
jgi:CMP-N,N'-diacetyllegionaminic acid synthase